MPSIAPAERALIVSSLINGGLGAAVGALIADVPGAKLGLIGGLLLATLPFATREIWNWLSQPRGLARFVMGRIGAAAIDAGEAVAKVAGSLIGPIVAHVQGPAIAVRLAGDILMAGLAALLDGIWRVLATPLGVANVGALAVIVANLANLDFAAPIAFLALGVLLLVLLVSQSEARDEEIIRRG